MKKLLLASLVLASAVSAQISIPNTPLSSSTDSRFIVFQGGLSTSVSSIPSQDGSYERVFTDPLNPDRETRCYFSRTLSPNGTYTVMVGIEADIPAFGIPPRVFFSAPDINIIYPGSGGVQGWQAVVDRKTNSGINRSIYCTQMKAPYSVSTSTEPYRNITTDGGVGFTRVQFTSIDLMSHVSGVPLPYKRTEVFVQELKTTLCLNAQAPLLISSPTSGLPMPVTLHADGAAFGEVWMFTKSPGWVMAGSQIPSSAGLIGESVNPVIVIPNNSDWSWSPVKFPLEPLLSRQSCVQFIGFNPFGLTLAQKFPVGQAWKFRN